jgi:hypothetical protein
VRLEGHVVFLEEIKDCQVPTTLCVKNIKKNENLEDLSIDGITTL